MEKMEMADNERLPLIGSESGQDTAENTSGHQGGSRKKKQVSQRDSHEFKRLHNCYWARRSDT